MYNWSLLRLNPQNQSKYVDYIQENYSENVELYYPIYEKITRPHKCRHPVVVSRPVYPGYIFAKIDVNSRSVHLLVSCPLKARFIRFGGIIGIVPERVITELRRLESAKSLVRDQYKANPFTGGRIVRIHTPVYDIQAIIIRLVNGNRCMVDSSLGKVIVPVHQVQVM